MRIFFTTNAVKNYIMKEVRNLNRETFKIKNYTLFYVVTKEPIFKIPDFI